MKSIPLRFWLLTLQCLALSSFGILAPTVTRADDPYETGCGNDSQHKHKCKGCNGQSSNSNDNSDDNEDGDQDNNQGDDSGDCDETGANPINPTMANVTRELTDITVFGPASFSFARQANSRSTDFGTDFNEFGYANVWQHNWNYQLVSESGYILLRYPEGNNYHFYPPPNTPVPFPVGTQLVPEADNGDRLFKTASSPDQYVLLTATGRELQFNRSTSPYFHLVQVRNGRGFSWTLTYSSSDRYGHITRITNNFGRWIQIDGVTDGNNVRRITQLTTSDGRTVTYNYSNWSTTGISLLTGVNYPEQEHAVYTYVSSDPGDPTAHPLIETASDPGYAEGQPGTHIKYVYNFTIQNFGQIQRGTLLEERNGITGQTIVQLPLGSGAYPKILEGDGTEITRKYTNGLLTTKADGMGRTINFGRDSNGYGFITLKTDATGITSYTRDYAGRILLRTDALGHTIGRTYNPKGFMLTATDELGHSISWTRDTVNARRVRKDYPDGSYETWSSYNANSQPQYHRLRNGGTESFTYDNVSGNLTSKTDAAGQVWGYTYDPSGLVSSVTDPRLNTTSYTYNWRGQLVTVTHPDNTTVTYHYDNFGNRDSVTDEVGHTTIYGHDEYNRLQSVTDALDRTTTYEYGKAPGCNVCSYAGTPDRVTSASGKVTTYSYDASGLRTCQTVASGSADEATTGYTYDDRKNIDTMTDPRGKVWHYGHDDKHRRTSVTDPLGHITSWTYDDHGNKLTETRADNGMTAFEYNARNKLKKITDAAARVSQIGYDNNDNLKTITDARNKVYTFSYDNLNRKTALTYPDNSSEIWSYDPAGNISTYTTRAGQVKTSTYDSRNRETHFEWDDGETPSVDTTYDDAGKTLTIMSSVSTLSYTYDEANQLTSETEQIEPDEVPMSFIYAYDDDGNRTDMTQPSGGTVIYAYTDRNQVSGMYNRFAFVPFATFAYDANGNRINRTIGGTQTHYAYDDANRLLTIDHQNYPFADDEGVTFEKLDYIYNSVNNRTSRKETNVSPSALSDAYGYDATDQLTDVKYNFNAVNQSQDQEVSYNYDEVGNRSGPSGVADSVNGNTNYAVNNLNQYTAVGTDSPQYDTNGNLTSSVIDGVSWTYDYDAQNRLVGALSSTNVAYTFAYDGRNRCVMRLRSTQLHHTWLRSVSYYLYDGWNLVEEQAQWDSLTALYVHGPQTDEMISRSTYDGDIYYFQDALGSTVALTDQNGNVVERYKYDGFGAPTFFDSSLAPRSSSLFDNHFLFTGREYLSDISLYDYRNRIFSPFVGRFLQIDPKRFDSGDINFYRYVFGNPVNYFDPSGLQLFLPAPILDPALIDPPSLPYPVPPILPPMGPGGGGGRGDPYHRCSYSCPSGAKIEHYDYSPCPPTLENKYFDDKNKSCTDTCTLDEDKTIGYDPFA